MPDTTVAEKKTDSTSPRFTRKPRRSPLRIIVPVVLLVASGWPRATICGSILVPTSLPTTRKSTGTSMPSARASAAR